MSRIEVQHNTRQQVLEYLTEGLAIVDELELVGDLREPAFLKAVDLLASKTVQVTAPAAGGVDLGALLRQEG